MKKLLFILLLLISFASKGQILPTDIKDIKTDGSLGMRAKIYVPHDTVRYPLLVFLHGIGEVHATDLNRVLKYGPLYQLSVLKVNIGEPKIIVHPQNPSGTWSVGEIDEVIEYCKKTYPVDTDRIYLMGVSLGGYGVWTYAQSAEVKKLAAIVPICAGGNDPSKAGIVAAEGIPGWASHAKNDITVSYTTGRRMVDAVNRAAGKSQILFTEYGLYGHSIWNTFLKPEFGVYEWLKYQRLSNRVKPKTFDSEKFLEEVKRILEEMK